MVVLGIDPGIANTGYGIVARHRGRLVALDGGVVETAAGLPVERRLAAIYERLVALIDEHRPVALAIEDLYWGRNVRSASAVGHARGACLLAAAHRGLPCHSYTPQVIKQAVCGSGAADKGQVQRMVTALLGLAAIPAADHAADALAAAICLAGSSEAMLSASAASATTSAATPEVPA